jgi:hypothetical protein
VRRRELFSSMIICASHTVHCQRLRLRGMDSTPQTTTLRASTSRKEVSQAEANTSGASTDASR